MAGKTNFGKINGHLSDLERKGFGSSDKTKLSKDDFFKMSMGENTFMVLPPFDEDSDIFVKTTVHFGFLRHDGVPTVYKCSREKYGRCPICDVFWEYPEEERKAKKSRANEIKPTNKFIYNVADHNFKNKIAELNASQHREVMLELKNCNVTDPDFDVTQPINGMFLKIERLKVDPWARGRMSTRPSAISEEVAQSLLDNLYDIRNIYIDNTPEELDQMLDGVPINVPKNTTTEESEEEVSEDVPAEEMMVESEEVTTTPVVEEELPEFTPPPAKTPTRAVVAPPVKVAPKPAPVTAPRPTTPVVAQKMQKPAPAAVAAVTPTSKPVTKPAVAGKAPAPTVTKPTVKVATPPVKAATPAPAFELSETTEEMDPDLMAIEAALRESE